MAITIGAPNREQARQMALMMKAGMPSHEAIRYFLAEVDDSTEWSPASVEALHKRWMTSKELGEAQLAMMGKPWQGMSLEEQMRYAVDKHYAEMAYYLYSHNYSELNGAEKQKADTCRQVLETKIAGMAGKMNALETFLADLTSGRVKAPQPSTTAPSPAPTHPAITSRPS